MMLTLETGQETGPCLGEKREEGALVHALVCDERQVRWSIAAMADDDPTFDR
jgi:hypothetical protein